MEDILNKLNNIPSWANILLFIVGGIILAGQGIETKFLGISFYEIFLDLWNHFLAFIA